MPLVHTHLWHSPEHGNSEQVKRAVRCTCNMSADWLDSLWTRLVTTHSDFCNMNETNCIRKASLDRLERWSGIRPTSEKLLHQRFHTVAQILRLAMQLALTSVAIFLLYLTTLTVTHIAKHWILWVTGMNWRGYGRKLQWCNHTCVCLEGLRKTTQFWDRIAILGGKTWIKDPVNTKERDVNDSTKTSGTQATG